MARKSMPRAVTAEVAADETVKAAGGGPAACGDCRSWFAFDDVVADAGECRASPPTNPYGPATARGRVCGYPVTLRTTPKCPLYLAR